jgi:hypothetical protein
MLSAAGLAALAAVPSAPHGELGVTPGWRRWLWSIPARSADPLDAVAAGARLIAIAALTYLVLVTAANLALSFTPAGRRRSRTWRALQSLTPRWLAAASIGVAIGAGPVAAQQPAGPPDGRAAPVMELVDDAPRPSSGSSLAPTATPRSTAAAPSTVATPTTVDTIPRPTSSMPWADDADPPMIDPSSPLQPIPEATAPTGVSGPTTTSAPAPLPEQPTAASLPSADQLPPSMAVHRVQPGEHFWSIAEQVVIERDGPSASDAEIAAYWRQLVEVNRDRLVDPDDPDLVLPGQVFELPW